MGRCGDAEALPAILFDRHAKTAHQVQRYLDIGLGNELPDHRDLNGIAMQRSRHQQRGQKLTGYVAAYGHRDHRARARRCCGFDRQRRVAVRAQIANICAEPTQRIDQIANGTLVHPRHAGQLVTALAQRQRRGERAERRTRVAEEQ